jgi:hypothetical protein
MSALSNASWPSKRTGDPAYSLLRLVEPIPSSEGPAPAIVFVVMIDIPTSLIMNPLRTADKFESMVPVLAKRIRIEDEASYVSAVHEGVFEPPAPPMLGNRLRYREWRHGKDEHHCSPPSEFVLMTRDYSCPTHDEVFGSTQRLDVLISNETAIR